MKRHIAIVILGMIVSCCMVAMEPQERKERTRDPQPQRGWEQPKQGEILKIRGRGNTVTYLDTATGKSTTYDIVEDPKKQKRSHRSKRKQKRENLPIVPEEEGRSTQEEEVVDPKSLSYDSSI